MSNVKSYKLGDLATISFTIVEDNKDDKRKTKFKYEIDFLKPEGILTEIVANKVATLTFLFIQSHGAIFGNDIADSLSTNERCDYNFESKTYFITSEGAIKDFRLLNDQWKRIVKHPDDKRTGWIISGLTEARWMSMTIVLAETARKPSASPCATLSSANKAMVEAIG